VEESCTTAQLKTAIGNRYDILTHMEDYRLTYNCDILEDDKTLADHGISSDATITMTSPLEDPDFCLTPPPPAEAEAERKFEERRRRIAQLTDYLQAASGRQYALQAQAARIASQRTSAEDAANDLLRQYNEMRFAADRGRQQRAAVEAVRARYDETRMRVGLLKRQQQGVGANLQSLGAQIGVLEHVVADCQTALAIMEGSVTI